MDNPRTCDIWDTDYNSDNWEPEFMTIFVIWQLIVTLDSIRNSCDVFFDICHNWQIQIQYHENKCQPEETQNAGSAVLEDTRHVKEYSKVPKFLTLNLPENLDQILCPIVELKVARIAWSRIV